MSDRALEVRVGAFTLGALALLGALYFVVGNPVLGPGVNVAVDYAFSGPIKPGASVRISGVTVGRVQEVEFLGNRPTDAPPDHPLVRLHLFVQARARPLLTEGSRFHVTTLGVLGEHYIDILPGPAGAAQLAEGAVARGVDSPRTDLLMARMAQLMDQVGRVLDDNDTQLKDLLGAATRLLLQVDVILKDRDVAGLLNDAQGTLTDIRALLGATRKALRDPEAISSMVADGRAMAQEGRVVMGDLKQVLTGVKGQVPEVMTRANLVLGQAEQLTVRVDVLLRALEKSGLADEGKLASLLARGETVMERADKLSTRADALLQRLEKGEGTVGKLMKDDKVYEDLKALLSDLRANPWKLMLPGRKND
ncbi:MAG: MCE family protein [Deltaproteobacteria bacterium]|nr:MCE family protein [Deltaproteobacteria bacterium]